MNLDFIFPTPVWWEDIGIDNKEVQKYCYLQKDKDPTGRKLSNRGGWQSQDLPLERDLKFLVDHIIDSCSIAMSHYGFHNTKLSFGNSWINISSGSDTNNCHNHQGSFLSGVYYVKVNENSGHINFYRDFNQSFITSSYAPVVHRTPLTRDVVAYTPKVGRLIVFPSNLVHEVTSSIDDEDRISISFNMGIVNT
jgi:uncharacterized protein (TIGR02466 family)